MLRVASSFKPGHILVDAAEKLKSTVEVFAPQYFFYNAPYVIKDFEHLVRMWNGSLGKKLKGQVLANGNMISLGIIFRELR